MEDNGLPSRTSILTAAARAFGSREPDASVRNPDWVADRLISPAELALIAAKDLRKLGAGRIPRCAAVSGLLDGVLFRKSVDN